MTQSTPELIACCCTIAGDVEPLRGERVSRIPFAERARVAAEAGYVGIGLDLVDILHVAGELGMVGIRRILADCGFTLVELERHRGWFSDGTRREASYKELADLLRVSSELGVRHVKVGGGHIDAGDHDVPVDRIADDFGRLCLEFDAIGTRVVLEPMPFSTIPTLEMAGAIVVGAGQPNGGIVLDAWHIAHMDGGYDGIALLPAGTIGHVELDDGYRGVVVDLLDDTANRRKLCGEGELDVPEFLRAVRAAGYRGPYGVEILSEEHRSLPLPVQARRSFDTALAQFAKLD